MGKIVFKSRVVHGVGAKKHVFEKLEECPVEFAKEMEALGVLEELPEPVQPKKAAKKE